MASPFNAADYASVPKVNAATAVPIVRRLLLLTPKGAPESVRVPARAMRVSAEALRGISSPTAAVLSDCNAPPPRALRAWLRPAAPVCVRRHPSHAHLAAPEISWCRPTVTLALPLFAQ